ncbi:MAG: hypothetical protein A3B38_04265 [Candidatus Levybacteria bacterium RIFCSPLOWO2_01_FULL_36_13]|nr:MAG: hypothetical protein A2684_01190 [Candidatus Levybacteria bacterium RIFCSPHIGHO2_01_FULL_36_15b]OGH34341.1 MAG: hypothetical protein A3B38_04265 [Candidatus Levybacteria bacterium RIFCSPLOWO2_01_FULL_36_13]
MNISNLLNVGKKEDKEYYLSLILRNEKAKAVIFEKTGSNLKYISSSEEEFTNTIEDASLEEFLNVLDKAVSGAETSLGTSPDKYKTILALKDNWIEADKIKKEYLDKLKKVGEELSLDPIGFLTFSESVTNLLQKEEGAPVTAILAEIGKKYLTVYYIKSGKIMEARTTEIHEGASFTVDTLLKHLETPAVMPARVILLNSDEDELTQEFLNHQWSKSLNFLHIPQIMMLPANADVKAVLLGAATQMGATLQFDENQIVMEKREEGEEENVSKNEVAEEIKAEDKETGDLDYVGQEGSMDFFGFSNADVAKNKPRYEKPKDSVPSENLNEVSEEIPEDVKIREEKKSNLGALGVLLIEKAKTSFTKARSLVAKDSLRNLNIRDKKMLLIAGVVILGVILFYFIFLFQAKAKVNITVKTITQTKNAEVTFSPNSSTKLDENIIEATIVPIEESGSTTIDVVGKKDVGTNAKGTVTVFNNDTDPIKLNEGTVITSSNGLKFTLDKTISIASASGDVFSGTKPGTANVEVTAEKIGTEYNLPSDTKFTIGSNKAIGAKNDNAFSGGTKKNVNVVSKDDMAKARAALPKALEDKAKEAIAGKIEKGKTILPQFVDTDLSDEKFDKKEGDESNKLTLNATVAFNYIAYENSDMISLVEMLFDSAEVNILKSAIKTDVKKLTVEKNRDTVAELAINVKVLPKLDLNEIKTQIQGQDLQKAQNYLNNLQNVEKVETLFNPSIPFLNSGLPKNPNNIEINVQNN